MVSSSFDVLLPGKFGVKSDSKILAVTLHNGIRRADTDWTLEQMSHVSSCRIKDAKLGLVRVHGYSPGIAVFKE